MEFHLAQFNVAKARYPLDDLRMGEFVNLLQAVNREGELAPGFVWILKDGSGTAVNFNPFNDPSLLVNLTVWESLESLRQYVYHGLHGQAFAKRKAWFETTGKEHLVLWWIPKGHIPTLAEAKHKMEMLWKEGPSGAAFTFKKLFIPPNL